MICKECEEERKIFCQQLQLCSRCYGKQWYQKNKEYAKEKQRIWINENREKAKEISKKSYRKNKEKILRVHKQ